MEFFKDMMPIILFIVGFGFFIYFVRVVLKNGKDICELQNDVLALHECLREQREREIRQKENEVFEIKPKKNTQKRDSKGRFCKDSLISKNVENNFSLR